METATQIKDRIAKLAATMPQDEDSLAEARAEQRTEKRLGIVLEQGGENPGLRNMTVADLREHPEWIKVGMGVTLATSAGGLYVPYTVIEVRRNGRELVIQRDKTIIDGPNSFADEAPRHYETDPNGKIETITKRKDGSYIVKGTPKEWYSTRYIIGYRRDWTDYSQ